MRYNGLIKIISNVTFLRRAYQSLQGLPVRQGPQGMKSKPGNMTKSVDNENLDGISIKGFEETSENIRSGKFAFKPMRQVEITKAKGKTRTLRIASPREKVVQKAIQLVLEAIYEPKFSEASHGFRPNRSTHTALKTLYLKGGNSNIAINGDITKCFDSIKHKVILDILKENIKCHRTLELIHKYLKVKSVFNGRTLKSTDLGTPPKLGSVLSPILANIVLDKFDKYMEKYIRETEKGKTRKVNPTYHRINNRRYKTKDPEKKKELLKNTTRLNLPPYGLDPECRRMIYVRYADDFIILITGNLKYAHDTKNAVKDFLKTIGLELNTEKTTIVQTRKGFQFLGARCKRAGQLVKVETKSKQGGGKVHKRLLLRSRLLISANLKELIEKLKKNRFVRCNKTGRTLATARKDLVNKSHLTIVAFYNNKIRVLLNYYTFASNYASLRKIV